MQVAKRMKDPKSMDIDRDQTRIKLNNGSGSVTIFYRAKNSFGAVVPGASRCDFTVRGTNTQITKIVAPN